MKIQNHNKSFPREIWKSVRAKKNLLLSLFLSPNLKGAHFIRYIYGNGMIRGMYGLIFFGLNIGTIYIVP